MKRSRFEMVPSLEMETQTKLKTRGKKANAIQVHTENVVKQQWMPPLCTNFSGTFTKRQYRNKPETLQNAKKLLISHKQESHSLN